MQVPVSSETKLDKMHKSNIPLAFMAQPLKPVQPGSALPFELRVLLKPLREYLNDCRLTLNDIRMDFEHFKMDSGNPSILSRTAKQLGRFCLEADSWGFNSIYDVALALQKVILESGGRDWSDRLLEAFNKGLDTLSALVERCESDYCCQFVIDETLECLSRVALGSDQAYFCDQRT